MSGPHPPSSLLGPGRFICVVGPSGAGKDTVISGAKAALAQDSTVIFPRRLVTRTASEAEQHDTIDEVEFKRRRDQSEFALYWQAHGLHYGISRNIDDGIRAGHTVICNVSRGVVAAAGARYARVTVVQVTAPPEVLADRLASRARASDGPLLARVERNEAYSNFKADMTIDNSGSADAAIRQFLATIIG